MQKVYSFIKENIGKIIVLGCAVALGIGIVQFVQTVTKYKRAVDTHEAALRQIAQIIQGASQKQDIKK